MSAAANGMPLSAPRLLTLTAAAAALNISRTSLYSIVAAGCIGYCRVGADRRIPESELAAFVERRLVKATS